MHSGRVEAGETRYALVVDKRTQAESARDQSARQAFSIRKPLGHHGKRRNVGHSGADAADDAVSRI
jgi:hypothetical protein